MQHGHRSWQPSNSSNGRHIQLQIWTILPREDHHSCSHHISTLQVRSHHSTSRHIFPSQHRGGRRLPRGCPHQHFPDSSSLQQWKYQSPYGPIRVPGQCQQSHWQHASPQGDPKHQETEGCLGARGAGAPNRGSRVCISKWRWGHPFSGNFWHPDDLFPVSPEGQN